MRYSLMALAVIILLGIGAALHSRAAAPIPPTPPPAMSQPATPSAGNMYTGWTLLKEGEAEGTMLQDAKHPSNTDQHLLQITVTKTAAPGKGRAGAINTTVNIPVENDHWYDVTFTAATERGSIGLVFSLETADGKVLARTTLPEIGRGGRRGRGAPPTTPPSTAPASPPAWPKYLVSLHARAADPQAHLTITPIEPTNIWLDNLSLTSRDAAPPKP